MPKNSPEANPQATVPQSQIQQTPPTVAGQIQNDFALQTNLNNVVGTVSAQSSQSVNNDQRQSHIDAHGQRTNDITQAETSQNEAPISEESIKQLISEAIKPLQAQFNRSLQTQLDNARSEGERLATMTEEERKAEEERIEREKFQKEKAEYEESKLMYETSRILGDMKFSPEFAEFVAKDDAKTTKARIDKFSELMNKFRQDVTNELMRGTAPIVPSGAAAAKPIEQMTYTEQAAYMAAQRNI